MRKYFALLSLVIAMTAKAQVAADTIGKRINIISSLGLGMIDNSFKASSGNSIQTSTGLEYQISSHSTLVTTLSFDSYGYQKSGTGYTLDGKIKATALALSYRYKFGTQKWRPYLKAGGGGAWLTVPTVAVGQGITNIKNEMQFVGLFLGEAGVQVRFISRYSLFLGAERDYFASSSLLDNASLRATTFKVGLISSF